MDYRARWQNKRHLETRRRSLAATILGCAAAAAAVLMVCRRPVPIVWTHGPGTGEPALIAAGPEVVYVAAPGARVTALRARTGLPLWPVAPDAPADMAVAPVPAAASLICVSDGGAVWALDRRTGQELWRVETGATVRCSPLVSNGLVVVANDDGLILALDAGTGVERWRFDAAAAVSSRPAASRGLVIAAGSDGRVHALDGRSGRPRWSHALGAPVLADLATIGDGVVAITEGGSVCLLAVPSGYHSASADLPQVGISRFPPLADGDRVVIATAEGWLACYAAHGLSVIWERKVADALCGGPALLAGRIYCPTPSGRIVCVQSTSGHPCGGWGTGVIGPVSVEVCGGLLVAALGDGRVVAYHPRGRLAPAGPSS